MVLFCTAFIEITKNQKKTKMEGIRGEGKKEGGGGGDPTNFPFNSIEICVYIFVSIIFIKPHVPHSVVLSLSIHLTRQVGTCVGKTDPLEDLNCPTLTN